MKRKIFLLLLLLFLTTGCDVEYSARIADGTYLEETKIKTSISGNETVDGEPLKDILQSYVNANIPSFYNSESYNGETDDMKEGVEYYSLSSYQDENQEVLEVTYPFDFYNLHRSQVIKECFKEVTVQKIDNAYRIHTNKGCDAFSKYRLLDYLTISLITPYDVISSNADQVENDHYYWYFTKDNASTKNISITFQTVKEDLSGFVPTTREPEKENPLKTWINQNQIFFILLCFGGFILVILAIIIVPRVKRRKS